MRDETRDSVVIEVESRVLEACLRQAELPEGVPVDVLLNDTLYHEKKRLELHTGAVGWSGDIEFWDGVKSRLGRASDEELTKLLRRTIGRFVQEIVGHFEPWVYSLSTSVLPRVLPLVFNAVTPLRLLSDGMPDLSDSLELRGRLDGLRRCHRQGTVILAPTHTSNLDSAVLAWALYSLGLPPFTYGAGLNLFTNPLLSFFMRNLGAYRVDRQKTSPLYKDTLKEYATVTLEKGQNQLFFPGGTRSRSGSLEQHLKLGLLSCGLRAYINNLVHKRHRPRVYIVPCNLNYHLVLEAETLIEDHLKLVGKSRYIITDDESSRPRQVMRFLHNVLHLDSSISVTMGDPMDPFGNKVNDQGESVDGRGRVIDIERYVLDAHGAPGHYPQRDRVYTRQAGQALAAAFRRGNSALPTNLVAMALFEVLRSRFPSLDLYRLLRTAGGGTGTPIEQVATAVGELVQEARAQAERGELHLSDEVRKGNAADIITSALRHFGTYHTHPVITRRGDRLFADDMNLLYYYRNRLDGYGLESSLSSGVRGR